MTADAVGGVWTFALELARGLADQGVETLLAVLGPAPDAAQRRAAFAVPGLRLALTGLPLEWQDRAGPFDAGARRRLLALERAFRPDIVHASGFREAAAGFAAPVLLTAHSCVRTWWRACRGGDPPPEWDFLRGRRAPGPGGGRRARRPHRRVPFRLRRRLGPAAAGARRAERARPAAPAPRPAPARGPGRRAPVGRGERDRDPRRRRPSAALAGRGRGRGGRRPSRRGSAPPRPAGAGGPARPHGGGGDLRAPARYEPFGLGILEAATQGCALVLGDLPSLVELWKGAARFVAAGRAGGAAGGAPGADRRHERPRAPGGRRPRAGRPLHPGADDRGLSRPLRRPPRRPARGPEACGA